MSSIKTYKDLRVYQISKKRNPKEAARFYEMAMNESDEMCVHLSKAVLLSKRFKRIPADDCKLLEKEYHSLQNN